MDYTLAYLYKEKREKRIDSNPVCRIAMIKRRGRIHRRHGWESGRRSADLNVFCSFWFFANLCSFCPPTRAAGDGGGEDGKRAREQVGVLVLEAKLWGLLQHAWAFRYLMFWFCCFDWRYRSGDGL